jgi:8-hydroxy-5-deazaflavin:NADPH oxidoreductase
MQMNIGIIGAGDIGQAFAGQVVKAGYEVIVSNSRGPESLTGVVHQLGPLAKAGVRQEAAQADVVVLAVPWSALGAALSDLPAWSGRILIDATNPVVQPGFRLADLNGSTSSEIVASLVPGARVVKGGKYLGQCLGDSRSEAGRRTEGFVHVRGRRDGQSGREGHSRENRTHGRQTKETDANYFFANLLRVTSATPGTPRAA